MQSDYEIEAHVAYRFETARNMRQKIAVAHDLRQDNEQVEKHRRPLFGLPRLVRRPT